MDNLPSVPDVNAQASVPTPTPLVSVAPVAAVGGMKATVIVASIAVVLVGAGLATWFSTSSNDTANIAATGDEMSETPPSLKQVSSGLKGSFADAATTCQRFDAADMAAGPAMLAAETAAKTPSMELTAGTNYGVVTKDVKVEDLKIDPKVSCYVLALYDTSKKKFAVYPNMQQFGPGVDSLEKTTLIKANTGVIIFANKSGTVFNVGDAKTTVASAGLDTAVRSWSLATDTADRIRANVAAKQNSIIWIYDPTATEKNGLPFARVTDLSTLKSSDKYLAWILPGKAGSAGVSGGSTPALEPVKTTPAAPVQSTPAQTLVTTTTTPVTTPLPATTTVPPVEAQKDTSTPPSDKIVFKFGEPEPETCPEGTYLSREKSETGGIICNRIPELTLLPTVEDIDISCRLYQELISGSMDRRLDDETTKKVMEFANDPLCNPSAESTVVATESTTPERADTRERESAERVADIAAEELDRVPTSETVATTLTTEEEAELLARRTEAAATVTTEGSLLPTISSCNPRSGTRGQPVRLDIQGTNLDTATALTLGGLVHVNAPTEQDATSAHYEFIIRLGTPLGVQDLVVTNPRGSDRCKFTVNDAPAAATAATTTVVDRPTTTTATPVTSTTPTAEELAAIRLAAQKAAGVTPTTTTTTPRPEATAPVAPTVKPKLVILP